MPLQLTTQMKPPVRYKTLLKTLIAIAVDRNDYEGLKDSPDDRRSVSFCIGDIQNWIGENRELLERFGLEWKG